MLWFSISNRITALAVVIYTLWQQAASSIILAQLDLFGSKLQFKREREKKYTKRYAENGKSRKADRINKYKHLWIVVIVYFFFFIQLFFLFLSFETNKIINIIKCNKIKSDES